MILTPNVDGQAPPQTRPPQHHGQGDSHLFEEPDDILTDLRQAHDDIVGEDVIEGGMITALPPRLVQKKVPTADRREEVLVFPGGSTA